MKHHDFPLTDELVELIVERMTLLGNPTRIRILSQLRTEERHEQAVADALTTTRQSVRTPAPPSRSCNRGGTTDQTPGLLQIAGPDGLQPQAGGDRRLGRGSVIARLRRGRVARRGNDRAAISRGR